jgi:predicted nucleotidyltransferase
MKLDPDHLFAGLVPARSLRDYFKQRQNVEFGRSDFAEQLGLAPGEAGAVLEDLLEEGLIEVATKRPKMPDTYRLTTSGGQLAHVSFAKRITRRKAETLLAELIGRAEAINADPELMYRVVEVRVFGSYLTDASDLGDLDVAFELARRNPQRDIIEENLERAERSGKTRITRVDHLGYGEVEVTKMLRGKGRVSLHELSELKLLGVEGEVVLLART